MGSFWAWLINGFYHSLVLYIASTYIFQYDLPQGDGATAGHWVWGTALYTAVLATVLGKAALVTTYVPLICGIVNITNWCAHSLWTKYAVMAIPGSMVIWMIWMPVYATVAPMIGFSTEYYGVLVRLVTSPVFWGMAVVLPAFCLIRDFAWKYAKRMYYPQTYHHIQEIQKYNIQDYRPRYVSRRLNTEHC
jgi:phospholipid-transporting ATPase